VGGCVLARVPQLKLETVGQLSKKFGKNPVPLENNYVVFFLIPTIINNNMVEERRFCLACGLVDILNETIELDTQNCICNIHGSVHRSMNQQK
jgi:hypothetical protein